jgi:hypothetical protein
MDTTRGLTQAGAPRIMALSYMSLLGALQPRTRCRRRSFGRAGLASVALRKLARQTCVSLDLHAPTDKLLT